jgi:hypothetical protein
MFAIDRWWPLQFWPAAVWITACQVVLTVCLYRLLAEITGDRRGRSVWLTVLLGTTPIFLSTWFWWANALHVLTSLAATVASAYLFVRWWRRGNVWRLVGSLAVYTFGLGFYEKPLLLVGLLPLLVGPGSRERVAPLLGAGGRLGSPALSIVDDGRLPNGLLATAVDGEGVPTRPVPLVDQGVYRQPLLAWWQARGAAGVASGCSSRPSFRDLPSPGPTHLFVRPQEGVRPAMLVGGVTRGCYVLDVDGPGRFDLGGDRFALPVCGFHLADGTARRPFSGGWLCGSIGALLRGVDGVARDLTFFPLAGMVGSPTLRVAGLEVRAEPGP